MFERVFVDDLKQDAGTTVRLAGWVRRVRELAKVVFYVVQDGTGSVQVVLPPALHARIGAKTEDAVVLLGLVVTEQSGRLEIQATEGEVVGAAAPGLPFASAANAEQIEKVGPEVLVDHRPLSLRTDRYGAIFRVQAALVEAFREALRRRRFTEIFVSKIVEGGTEGGSNLFPIKYFERTAYLAQSPQFFKEECVAGLDRVFETAHVYRAEPHATSRHLTEFLSLDLEMGFISGPEELVRLEAEVLTEMFEAVRARCGALIEAFDVYAPDLTKAPRWEFGECLERLGRPSETDDLDGAAERELCAMAEKEAGVQAVFVMGYPRSSRPFYTAPREDGRSHGFDLLFRGVEITSGGQRLHTRAGLEAGLRAKGFDPAGFEPHLRAYDLGMPPHGGLAIGAERLTQQILGLKNVREATLYPRDRTRISP